MTNVERVYNELLISKANSGKLKIFFKRFERHYKMVRNITIFSWNGKC